VIDARHVANTFGKSYESWSDLILFAAYDSPSWSLLLQSIGQRMCRADRSIAGCETIPSITKCTNARCFE